MSEPLVIVTWKNSTLWAALGWGEKSQSLGVEPAWQYSYAWQSGYLEQEFLQNVCTSAEVTPGPFLESRTSMLDRTREVQSCRRKVPKMLPYPSQI